jgi:predicted XRE-type DNA-binding protein
MNAIMHGTTNVFDDLGYADAAERQTKTRLAFAVNDILKSRKLKQREIAALLGVPQPRSLFAEESADFLCFLTPEAIRLANRLTRRLGRSETVRT